MNRVVVLLLESRIHQRRKELDEIRQKSNRFNSNVASLHSDADRILQMIEKSPDVRLGIGSKLACR